jgi:hypothetical protein
MSGCEAYFAKSNPDRFASVFSRACPCPSFADGNLVFNEILGQVKFKFDLPQNFCR